jgi:hypothetical protein
VGTVSAVRVTATTGDHVDIGTLKGNLADIRAHVEPIAAESPVGSEVNVLAHAIRNLCICTEFLSDEIDLRNRDT